MSKTSPAHMAVVAGGTILAQLVNIVGFLVATRILTPTDFGLFGVHIAISAPLAILATGRYEVAFIRARLKTKVANLFILAVLSTIVFALAAIVVLAAVLALVGPVPGFSLTVVGALLTSQALVNCTVQLNTYNGGFYLIALSRVLGAVAAQICIVVLAVAAGAGHHALGFGMAIGMLVSAALSFVGNAPWLKDAVRTVRPARIRTMALRNTSYLLFNGPQALASALQETAAVSVITAFFGQAATGLYVFANRMMRAPISIVAESAGRVLQKQIGDMAEMSLADRRRFLRTSTSYLAAIALAFGVAVWIMAMPVVTLLFSAEWQKIGALIRAGAPYYATYLVASSLAAIPLATGDHRPMALLGMIGSCLYAVLLAVTGVFETDFPRAFFIVSMVMAAYFFIFVYVVHYVVVGRHAR